MAAQVAMADSLRWFYGIGGGAPGIYCRCPAAAHTIIMGRPLYLAAVVTIFLLLLSSLLLAYSQWSEVGCLPYFHTWCGLSANLECTSEMCCDAYVVIDRQGTSGIIAGPSYTKQFNKKTKLRKQNGRWSNYSPSPYRKLIEEKINMNFEEKIKTIYKEVTENSDALSKNMKSELKNKYDAVKSRWKISKSVEKVRRDRRPTLMQM